MDLHHLLLAGLPAHTASPPEADMTRSPRDVAEVPGPNKSCTYGRRSHGSRHSSHLLEEGLYRRCGSSVFERDHDDREPATKLDRQNFQGPAFGAVPYGSVSEHREVVSCGQQLHSKLH